MTVFTAANQLTLLRMLLIPAFVILVIYGELGWALAVFVTAGLTDGLDGLLARWSDQRTSLGAWLDPMADKLLLVTTFVVLMFLRHLRSCVVVSLTMPLAVLVCFILMKVCGVDSNLMSLGGIAIAIGTLVDMGIILAENIVRHLDAERDEVEVVIRQQEHQQGHAERAEQEDATAQERPRSQRQQPGDRDRPDPVDPRQQPHPLRPHRQDLGRHHDDQVLVGEGQQIHHHRDQQHAAHGRVVDRGRPAHAHQVDQRDRLPLRPLPRPCRRVWPRKRRARRALFCAP